MQGNSWLLRAKSISKRPLAIFAALVGFFSGLIGIYQWATPVPVTIDAKEITAALRGREPCELIGARGLPCSGEGILQAASISEKMIDLFISAGVTGNAVVKRYDGEGYSAWAQAMVDGAPYAKYLTLQTIKKAGVIKSVSIPPRCEGNDGDPSSLYGHASLGAAVYTCSPLAQVSRIDDDELFCAVYRADPAARNMLRVMLTPYDQKVYEWSKSEWKSETKIMDPVVRMQMCENRL